MKSTFSTELEKGEAAVCLTLVKFSQAEELGKVVVVGIAKYLTLVPRKSHGGSIRVYSLTSEKQSLELLHKTELEYIPAALTPFHGKLVAGVGSILRIYDLGKKRMLRKCEYRQFPNLIISISYS